MIRDTQFVATNTVVAEMSCVCLKIIRDLYFLATGQSIWNW